MQTPSPRQRGGSSRERLPRLSGNPAHWARPVPPATHRIRFPHNGAKSSGESLREGLAAGSVWWAFSEGPRERRDRKAPFTEAFLLPLPVTSWRLRTLEPPDFRLDLANQRWPRPPQKRFPRPFGTSAHVVAGGAFTWLVKEFKSSHLPPSCPQT